VGVDGSDGSRTALEFALEEAVRRGAAVRQRPHPAPLRRQGRPLRLLRDLNRNHGALRHRLRRNPLDEAVAGTRVERAIQDLFGP